MAKPTPPVPERSYPSMFVGLVRNYYLATPQKLKHEDTLTRYKWTAFINHKVTLIHFMRHDCPWVLIRLPLRGLRYRNLMGLIKKVLYEDVEGN